MTTFNLLFLCTGNTSRSIMAEAILNGTGGGQFRAFSAGSQPAGHVNPFALEQIRKAGLTVNDLRSKSWEEFSAPESPHMDFIITVCDNAAGEVCPIWPGQPMSAHWGVFDPAAVTGTDTEKQAAFAAAFDHLRRRIQLFTSLPLPTLDRLTLKKQLDAIGKG